jgi:hypothetical protein
LGVVFRLYREECAVPENRKNHGRMRLLALGAAALALALPAADVLAANFFDMLFGGGRRGIFSPPSPLPSVRPSGDPSVGVLEGSREGGPSVSYCVRLCDGHPFPVQTTSGSAAQTCSSLCPAAQTKVFNGSTVDSAVSSDGKRYSSLPTAFVYRKQLVADCTCNGRSPGGLARIDAKSDPTLRPGDIVATNQGLLSYRGGGGKADFTPVQDRKLAAIKIRPAPASATATSQAALSARAQETAPPEIDEPKPKKTKRHYRDRERDRDRDYR